MSVAGNHLFARSEPGSIALEDRLDGILGALKIEILIGSDAKQTNLCTPSQPALSTPAGLAQQLEAGVPLGNEEARVRRVRAIHTDLEIHYFREFEKICEPHQVRQIREMIGLRAEILAPARVTVADVVRVERIAQTFRFGTNPLISLRDSLIDALEELSDCSYHLGMSRTHGEIGKRAA